MAEVMSEATRERLLEELRAVHRDVREARDEVRAITAELRAVGLHMAALVQSAGALVRPAVTPDTALYALTKRVERIERRLDLLD